MAEWKRDTLWRQGYLLPDEAIQQLNLLDPNYPDDTVVIVATHDCDLAQSPESEPNVELFVGRRIENLDGNNTFTKNARKLHIDFTCNDGGVLYAEFVSTDKRSISKEALANFSPNISVKLKPEGYSVFQRWLAVRYRRAAFPDAFERRLKTAKLDQKIAKALKQHGVLISAIFFDVDEGEEINRVAPDDLYTLDIMILYSVDQDPNAAHAAAEQAKEAIRNAFKEKLFDQERNEWQNIRLRYIETVSEDALTYRQSLLFKQWRLEYISFGDDPQQPILAE